MDDNDISQEPLKLFLIAMPTLEDFRDRIRMMGGPGSYGQIQIERLIHHAIALLNLCDVQYPAAITDYLVSSPFENPIEKAYHACRESAYIITSFKRHNGIVCNGGYIKNPRSENIPSAFSTEQLITLLKKEMDNGSGILTYATVERDYFIVEMEGMRTCFPDKYKTEVMRIHEFLRNVRDVAYDSCVPIANSIDHYFKTVEEGREIPDYGKMLIAIEDCVMLYNRLTKA